MLVVDPRKRLTMAQICHHPWMQEVGADVRQDPLMSDATQDGQPYNDHVLHLMQSLNIDKNKTIEVRPLPSVTLTALSQFFFYCLLCV